MARVEPDTWTPAVWSPAAVMDMQARLDPVRMTRRADDWQQAVDRIGDILADLDAQVTAQLERSWHGQGADASADALRRYVAGSLSGLSACRSPAVHLGELSTAAGELRAVVTAHDLDDAIVQVRQCYSGPAVAAGNAVEDIPPPPDPFQLARRPSHATLPSGVTQSANPMSVSQFPSSPTAFPPVSPALGWPGAGASSPTITPEPPWPAATHSSAAPPSPIDGPQPPRPDSPGTITGQPVSGPPPNSSSGPPQSFATRTMPSASMPFMSGMYPGHMAREGGGEHRTPRYPISAGNSNELIGELPLVAPPVIGE